MKTFLINEIGLSNLAATTLRDDHGFDLFNAFQSFLMTDIDDIYSTASKPGGLISNPESTCADPLPDIANPGVTVPVIVAKRLKLFVCGSKHLTRLSIPLSFATLVRASLDQYDHMQTIELSHVDPPNLLKHNTKENMTIWIETLNSHLLQTYVINVILLFYVVREDITFKPHAGNQPTNYGTKKLELVHRCPRVMIKYEEDNKKVWGILQCTLSTHTLYSSIRCHSLLENGRQIYLDLQ